MLARALHPGTHGLDRGLPSITKIRIRGSEVVTSSKYY